MWGGGEELATNRPGPHVLPAPPPSAGAVGDKNASPAQRGPRREKLNATAYFRAQRDLHIVGMPLIIDGEIVPDSDPRAVARRAGAQKPAQKPAPSNSGSAPGSSTPPPRSQPTNGPSPLDAIASAIGVQGQTIEIPAIWRVPSRQVPMIVAILLGGATLLFGWRVPAVAALLHVVSGLTEAGNAGNPARAGGAGNRAAR